MIHACGSTVCFLGRSGSPCVCVTVICDVSHTPSAPALKRYWLQWSAKLTLIGQTAWLSSLKDCRWGLVCVCVCEIYNILTEYLDTLHAERQNTVIHTEFDVPTVVSSILCDGWRKDTWTKHHRWWSIMTGLLICSCDVSDPALVGARAQLTASNCL